LTRRSSKKGQTPASVERAPAWNVIGAAILIVLFALFAYANSFAGVFVLDDEPAIARNENLREFPSLKSLEAPHDTTLSGRPVATLTFAVDTSLRGGTLVAYHQTNLTIHIVASLLLFGIVRRTLVTLALNPAFGSAATSLAFAVALLFVVHPLQTSSVTYIAQRVESLMGLFFLGTLYCAIRAADAAARASVFWSSLAVALGALGMATKEVMVAAPLVLMIWDRLFLESSERRPRRIFHIVLAATWIVLLILIVQSPRALSAGFGFEAWPWWRYLLTQATVIVTYLRLALIPAPLVFDYDWPAASWSEAAIPALVLTALFGWTTALVARRRPLGFPLACFFLILAPSSSVLPIVTEIAAEHRMYLPLGAVLAVVVAGVFLVWHRAVENRSIASFGRYLGPAAAIMIAFGFAMLTRARNEDYTDYERLWRKTVEQRPENARARTNLASFLLLHDRYAEAEEHLRVAVERVPGAAEPRANLGIALASLGRIDEAIPQLEQAVALNPGQPGLHRNLAESLAMRRRFSEALPHFEAALAAAPQDLFLMKRTAWLLAVTPDVASRNGARARQLAENAVRLTSGQDPEALDILAAALAETGDFEAAARIAGGAVQGARRLGDAALAAELEGRRALYLRRETYREH
jgi:protein O-mannosyl-transferase